MSGLDLVSVIVLVAGGIFTGAAAVMAYFWFTMKDVMK